MNISLDFNAKVGGEDIFKQTIGNESSHKISNDNGVRVVNSATFNNHTVFSTFSHIVAFINLLGHLLMEKRTIILPYSDRQATECR
jgi:hypothetical protein